MSDNTALQSTSGGDNIRTESLTGGTDQTSGLPVPLAYGGGTNPEIKVQDVKLLTGRSGVDGGPVTSTNPLQVRDPRVIDLLEQIFMLMKQSVALEQDILNFVRR